MNDYYSRRIKTAKPNKSGIERMEKLSSMRDYVRQEVLELVLSQR